ncbi:MAG: S1/P1 Nuclease [Candidatus Neomarinimicrobiota bacterium]|nr:MAG: S1/P1 Nuclease [Candidatus Neomarinimicrobiota bacterium]
MMSKHNVQGIRILGLWIVLGLQPGWSFGYKGHQIVALIAESYLSDSARSRILTLLAPDSARSLADISTWADEIRGDSTYDYAKPFHYVNLPPEDLHYDAQRDCPGDACVVGAIETYRKILANPEASQEQKREALKFLVHFVADLHQPLHAGHKADRGGNDIPVIFNGEETNLHRVWDYQILEEEGLEVSEFATRLREEITTWDRKQWEKGSPETWVEDSARLAAEYAYTVPENGVISPEYIEKGKVILEIQLKKAGVRLALFLNQVFGP